MTTNDQGGAAASYYNNHPYNQNAGMQYPSPTYQQPQYNPNPPPVPTNQSAQLTMMTVRYLAAAATTTTVEAIVAIVIAIAAVGSATVIVTDELVAVKQVRMHDSHNASRFLAIKIVERLEYL
ncbi:MAG: hypothetical protein MMC23_000345 [Stictis urceolatum]|nr:hypothetical protein [Stictis urceolata]